MCLGFFPTMGQASGFSYWQKYAQEKYPQYNYSRFSRPTYRYTRTPSKTSTNTSTTSRRVYNPYYGRNTSSGTSYTYPRYTSPVASGLTAFVVPKTQSEYIYKITNDPIDLFTIGFKNNSVRSSTTFNEALKVTQLKFQITDSRGLPSDLSDLSLVIDDQDFPFSKNGYLTLKFNNLRLAVGEDWELDVKVKVDDPDLFPRFSGSFRVKLLDIKATKESGVSGVPIKITGKTTSDYIVLNPSTDAAVSGNAQLRGQTIYGRNLTAGEDAVVLTTNLYAHGDDLILEKVTVRNTYGNNVDSLISQVNLWDLGSNRILGSRRFINGKATFTLSGESRLAIARNGRAALGFEVVVKDQIPSNVSENRLQLDIQDSDVVLYGYGAGRNVPDSQKSIDFDPHTFTVTQGGTPAGGGVAFSSVQPELVPTGSLSEVARFRIGNSGGGDLSIGRISLEAILNGLEFPGGLSTDDAALMMVHNGNVINNNLFNVTSASGNKIVFDANSEVYIDRNQTREFSLMLKLNNTGSTSSSDSVAVKILGDGSLGKGPLSSVRSSNYNFIWSDHSGRPHTQTSSDWFSGYLLGGLPTNYFVNRRD